MAVVYLVRHGQAGQGGIPAPGAGSLEDAYDRLSDLGRRQVVLAGEAVAPRVAGLSVPVVSGPRRRHLGTAAALRDALDSAGSAAGPVEVDGRWSEFDSDTVVAPWLAAHPSRAAEIEDAQDAARASGAAADRAVAGRLTGRMLRDAMAAWTVGDAGYAGFRATVLDGMSSLAGELHGGDGAVVVSTSAGAVGVCVTEALGLGARAWPEVTMRILNASVSAFRVRSRPGAFPDLLSFNEHAHLDRPHVEGLEGDRPLRTFR